MRDDEPSTRTKILDVTRDQMMSEGVSSLTIQGVAAELGVTRQAVLYWFPSKTKLLQELFVEAMEMEGNHLAQVVEEASDAADAVERYLIRGLAYHQANLPRFRLCYALVQVDRAVTDLSEGVENERIYAATGRMYSALEEKFRAGPGFPENVDPRAFAISLHMSLLGHVCVYGTMEAVGDSFKQSFETIVDSLVAVVRASVGPGSHR